MLTGHFTSNRLKKPVFTFTNLLLWFSATGFKESAWALGVKELLRRNDRKKLLYFVLNVFFLVL